MEDKKKKSLWARLTGAGSDCGCCCGSVIEPIPENEKQEKVENEKKQKEDKAKQTSCCR